MFKIIHNIRELKDGAQHSVMECFPTLYWKFRRRIRMFIDTHEKLESSHVQPISDDLRRNG